jgi:hypothetical protein
MNKVTSDEVPVILRKLMSRPVVSVTSYGGRVHIGFQSSLITHHS